MSERPDLAVRDLYPVPAELSYNETVKVLVVSAAIVSARAGLLEIHAVFRRAPANPFGSVRSGDECF